MIKISDADGQRYFQGLESILQNGRKLVKCLKTLRLTKFDQFFDLKWEWLQVMNIPSICDTGKIVELVVAEQGSHFIRPWGFLGCDSGSREHSYLMSELRAVMWLDWPSYASSSFPNFLHIWGLKLENAQYIFVSQISRYLVQQAAEYHWLNPALHSAYISVHTRAKISAGSPKGLVTLWDRIPVPW